MDTEGFTDYNYTQRFAVLVNGKRVGEVASADVVDAVRQAVERFGANAIDNVTVAPIPGSAGAVADQDVAEEDAKEGGE